MKTKIKYLLFILAVIAGCESKTDNSNNSMELIRRANQIINESSSEWDTITRIETYDHLGSIHPQQLSVGDTVFLKWLSSTESERFTVVKNHKRYKIVELTRPNVFEGSRMTHFLSYEDLIKY